ncbi:helix-turn-helix transcriptional regulator [Virgibacillus halophilus]|uniref:Helix-turn-helix transcriptional regulator n=2 Tax=Tigheibacillus halophilus TaxID=361280 RepID=A0ABU5C5Z4_9BACI|nr:helix-turn-helix transcriptional regulator [Virgibacillus halophilus]
MSQEDMALELHMSISNVSRLESNKYELKAADLIRWCNITNAQEVLIALLCGMDGITIMQQLMDTATTLVGTIIGGLFI